MRAHVYSPNYARQAIQVRLKDDENRAEEAKMEEAEIRERLKD